MSGSKAFSEIRVEVSECFTKRLKNAMRTDDLEAYQQAFEI